MHKDFSSRTFICCLLLFGLLLIGAYKKKSQLTPYATRVNRSLGLRATPQLINTNASSDTLYGGQEGKK